MRGLVNRMQSVRKGEEAELDVVDIPSVVGLDAVGGRRVRAVTNQSLDPKGAPALLGQDSTAASN